MGGTLRFRELHGIDEDGALRKGARIEDLDGLRDHVDTSLSPSLKLSTREGDSYPRYEYLMGLYYGHDDEPYGGDPYFVDNVYPGDYGRTFADISEYTEPFVVLAAQSFPRLDELLHGIDRLPYVIYAANGEAEQREIDVPELPDFEAIATELVEGN